MAISRFASVISFQDVSTILSMSVHVYLTYVYSPHDSARVISDNALPVQYGYGVMYNLYALELSGAAKEALLGTEFLKHSHITHIDSFLHSKDLGLSSSAMSFHTTVSSKNSFQKKSGFVGCFAAIPRVCPSDMHSQAMPHRRSRSNGICDRTLSTFYAEIRLGYNSWVGSIGIPPFQAFQPSLSIINLGHF